MSDLDQIMNRRTLAAVLWKQDWREAKTWQKFAPHLYVLDRDWQPTDEYGIPFDVACASLRWHAVPRRWNGRVYQYFVWAEQQFWIMPYKGGGGLLINRADASTSEAIE
jgi:hypothetical protein